MADKPKVRHIDVYQTVAVTALPPGWRNVFSDIDDSSGEHESPCPALLLQELRECHQVEDVRRAGGQLESKTTVSHQDAPYETRVVFADWGEGELTPAIELNNYVRTLSPTETDDN
jgi:hypothetical protein